MRTGVTVDKTMWVQRTKSFAYFVLALMGTLCIGMLLEAKPAHAKTFTVTSSLSDQRDGTPGDGACITSFNECTLRAAIEEANATTASDTIRFNIPGSGVKTINPSPALPNIRQPVTINGYSQPGARANTREVGDNARLLIRLDGRQQNLVNGGSIGLSIESSNSVVRGLLFTHLTNALDLAGASNNTIEGNFIGTNAGGTQALGNGSSLEIRAGSTNNTVGGTSPEARNIISGNAYGVIIKDSGSTGNEVMGNYIGTTRSGTANLGNEVCGVVVGDGASGNRVGGTTSAAANIIAFNGFCGVGIYDDGASSTNNRILSNSIFSNAGLGIDLGNDGLTPNDPKDTDTGPNDLQNFPVLTSATTTGTSVTVRGNLNSTPNKTFTLQFFRNPSGTNEGKTFLAQRSVTTNANGNAPFTFTFAVPVAAAQRITATATGAGNTSEFSAARLVTEQQ
jgi:CSLREA domain-containing protein